MFIMLLNYHYISTEYLEIHYLSFLAKNKHLQKPFCRCPISNHSLDILKPNLHMSFNVPSAVSRS